MKAKKQEEPKTSDTLLERMAKRSELPRDVVLGMPILTIIGQTELCIENYRGITEYTPEMVRIQTKSGMIRITGKQLNVDYYTNNEMKVSGLIFMIEYDRKDGH